MPKKPKVVKTAKKEETLADLGLYKKKTRAIRDLPQEDQRSSIEHFEACRDSDMTITGIAKYLKRQFESTSKLNTFVATNRLVVPQISKKSKDTIYRNVAIEIWQLRRIADGKGRYPYASLIDED